MAWLASICLRQQERLDHGDLLKRRILDRVNNRKISEKKLAGAMDLQLKQRVLP
jgi:hypothetical protein